MLSFISKYCVQNDQLMIGLKNDTENEILLWGNDSLVKALAIKLEGWSLSLQNPHEAKCNRAPKDERRGRGNIIP